MKAVGSGQNARMEKPGAREMLNTSRAIERAATAWAG